TVDVEHFGFLSSVMRKRESHEQDGETLPRRATFARNEAASGDPAMAPISSFGWHGRTFRPALLGGLSPSVNMLGRTARAAHCAPPTPRADKRPRAKKSTTNAELLDHGLVARLVGALEVIEQLATLLDHLEKAPPRMVVFHVRFEVFG